MWSHNPTFPSEVARHEAFLAIKDCKHGPIISSATIYLHNATYSSIRKHCKSLHSRTGKASDISPPEFDYPFWLKMATASGSVMTPRWIASSEYLTSQVTVFEVTCKCHTKPFTDQRPLFQSPRVAANMVRGIISSLFSGIKKRGVGAPSIMFSVIRMRGFSSPNSGSPSA